MSRHDTILLMGGGMDSYAVALWLRDLGTVFTAIHVDYEQKSSRSELKACRKQLELLAREGYKRPDLLPLYDEGLLIRGLNPKGSLLFGDKKAGPELKGRNLVLLMLALTYLNEGGTVYLGLDRPWGDAEPFKDCTLDYFNRALEILDRPDVRVKAPFIEVPKKDVVEWGYQRDSKFLENTMSCWQAKYTNQRIIECGECKHCKTKKTLMEPYL